MSKTAAEVMAEINQAMKSPVLKMASADELRVEIAALGDANRRKTTRSRLAVQDRRCSHQTKTTLPNKSKWMTH